MRIVERTYTPSLASRQAEPSGSARVGRAWIWRRDWLLLLVSLPLLLFLMLPLCALILRVSLPDFLSNVLQREVVQAISLSIRTTLLTTLIAIVAGTPVAYLLARRHFPGRRVFDTLIDLPMVLPPSVAGLALLIAFGRRGLFGRYMSDVGIEIAFTQTAVVLAQLFVAAPYYLRAAMTGFAAVERELEQAASIDGAGPLRIFRYITLPLAGSALLGGIVMTWARALGEFGATIIFAGNFPGRTQTMPLAIYIGFELELNVALTLAAILLAVAFGVLLIVKLVLRRPDLD